jgi:hypothetical protein
MGAFPDIVTHNYHPARGIGGNICNLPHDEAERILDKLRALGRNLRPHYLQKRLLVEDWLIAEKNGKLGSTQLKRPVYFFLGNFADGRDHARPESLVMPLAAFPSGALTFTYADSMTSYQFGVVGKHARPQPHYGQVFTRMEIEAVVATARAPLVKQVSGDWPEIFVEVQVWDDRPIREWIAKTMSCDAGRPAVRIN